MKKHRKKLFLGVAILILVGIFAAEEGLLKIKSKAVFCDVGQGDGIFITLESKEQILIDGGPDNKMIGCVGEHMPYFDRTIEYMIISHPDKDHFVGAVEVLKRYNVKHIILNGDEDSSPEYEEFKKFSKASAIARAGDNIVLENGQITFFHPRQKDYFKDSNDNSLVFKFEYGGKSILFTGDISEKIEANLLAVSGVELRSDIIKISHHGSKTSSGEEFLKTVNPDLAIISVGADNKFGHPSYRIVKRLENLKIQYKRTDETGNIIVPLYKD